jgi:hypothetical protein
MKLSWWFRVVAQLFACSDLLIFASHEHMSTKKWRGTGSSEWRGATKEIGAFQQHRQPPVSRATSEQSPRPGQVLSGELGLDSQ